MGFHEIPQDHLFFFLTNMLNNQDFMKLNDVGSLTVKGQGMSERAPSDEDHLINGVKWRHGYLDDDRADDHLQLVPEIHKKEENPKEGFLFVVPDEHSETEDPLHHVRDFSYSSDKRCYLRNKHEKTKKRGIQISSDEESENFTREVPSVTRKGYKRRRRRDVLSDKMRKLQQLVPNCHKIDMVSVLDKTIEYMKNLQLQHQVMSILGMNPYFPLATLDFGMHNHLLTAIAAAHGQNPVNQASSSPLIPALNLPLPPFTNLSFPHSSAASTPECFCGLVPCFHPR